jgi:hypothetical protein
MNGWLTMIVVRVPALEGVAGEQPGTRRAALPEAPVTGSRPLPQHAAYAAPDWWKPYTAEFSSWPAWHGARRFWARLPGTTRVHYANDPCRPRPADPGSGHRRETLT